MIGQQIRRTRLGIGISMTELARRIGMELKQLHRIEVGETRNPRYDTLRRIAKGLGVELSELVTVEPEPATVEPSGQEEVRG